MPSYARAIETFAGKNSLWTYVQSKNYENFMKFAGLIS